MRLVHSPGLIRKTNIPEVVPHLLTFTWQTNQEKFHIHAHSFDEHKYLQCTFSHVNASVTFTCNPTTRIYMNVLSSYVITYELRTFMYIRGITCERYTCVHILFMRLPKNVYVHVHSFHGVTLEIAHTYTFMFWGSMAM